jgi:hypothetical protein
MIFAIAALFKCNIHHIKHLWDFATGRVAGVAGEVERRRGGGVQA